MIDKKRRLLRLIESYVNDYKGNVVQEMYGNGTKIKVHSISFGHSSKSVLLDVIIVLGDTINESVMDRKMIDVLLQDSLFYFFPEHQVKTYVRWDVE